MSTETIIVLLVVGLLIAALPRWSYSREWGYGPSGLLTVLGVVLVLWLFFGSDSRHIGTGIDAKPIARDGSLRRAADEVGDGIKEAGHDLKRTVQDATD